MTDLQEENGKLEEQSTVLQEEIVKLNDPSREKSSQTKVKRMLNQLLDENADLKKLVGKLR